MGEVPPIKGGTSLVICEIFAREGRRPPAWLPLSAACAETRQPVIPPEWTAPGRLSGRRGIVPSPLRRPWIGDPAIRLCGDSVAFDATS